MKKEKNVTIRGYIVNGPDSDNEIEIDTEDRDYIWLTHGDVLKLLALFKEKKEEEP